MTVLHKHFSFLFFLFPRYCFSSTGTVLWSTYREKSWPRSLPISTVQSPPQRIYLWFTLAEVRRDSSCAHAIMLNGVERPAGLKWVGFGAGAVPAQLCSPLSPSSEWHKADAVSLESEQFQSRAAFNSQCNLSLAKYWSMSFTPTNLIAALMLKHMLKCFSEAGPWLDSILYMRSELISISPTTWQCENYPFIEI